MVQDVRPGRHHRRQRIPVALEVRDQDFDAERRVAPLELANGGREDGRAAVVEVVARDRRDHDVAQVQARHGFGQALGLSPVDFARAAGFHVAEAAVAGTGIAQQQKRGGPKLAPALADIRARRFFADRVQLLLAHQTLQLFEVRPVRQRHLEPVRAAADDWRRGLRRQRLTCAAC